MGNYNYRELPPELDEFRDKIFIAAEVINGTNQVKIGFHSGPGDDAEMVYHFMDARQFEALAETIYLAAADARWARFTANRPDPEPRPGQSPRPPEVTRGEVHRQGRDQGERPDQAGC
ncbi:hypothetical protein [Amycolatopsis pigmentata]|uniref:Uncharacterized protein n=1 Tax=Amycolatopsis pigmentata TaxID=450801 RepID=A0ABW5G9T6_9PSEU